MDYTITLKLHAHNASLSTGFSFGVDVRNDKRPSILRATAILEPQPQILDAYNTWQNCFIKYLKSSRGAIKATGGKESEYTVENVRVAFQNLENRMRSWLSTLCVNNKSFISWLEAEEHINISNKTNDKLISPHLRFIIEIPQDHIFLAKLPWHSWDWLKTYPNAEISFYLDESRNPNPKRPKVHKPRIFSVVGDNTELNTQEDLKWLRNKTQPARYKPCLTPANTTPIKDELKQGCDVLFFAGHSFTDDNQTGRLYINSTTSITVRDIFDELDNAVQNGLQIAIFNSCDGIGIATDLQEIGIPCTIVMREPVPDRVAIRFFRNFMQAFAIDKKNIDLAFRIARESLNANDISNEFPGASNLPVLFLNPTLAIENRIPKWQNFFGIPRCRPIIPIVTTLVSGALIAFIRSTNILQGFEEMFYDFAIQNRHSINLMAGKNQVDNRIVLVTLNDEEKKIYGTKDGEYSISDDYLYKAITNIQSQKPALIVIDFFRPYSTENINLKKLYQSTDNLILACDETGKNPYPSEDLDYSSGKIGFVNFSHSLQQSEFKSIVRSFKVFSDPNSKYTAFCSDKFISIIAVSKYLSLFFKQNNSNLNSTSLVTMQPQSGFYQKFDLEGFGKNMLIDYISPYLPQDTIKRFEEIPITTVLGETSYNRLHRNIFSDKIVIIGINSFSIDTHITPFHTNLQGSSSTKYPSTPGVYILAEITSQMIDIAQGNRRSLWFLNSNFDIGIIFITASLGALISWGLSNQKSKTLLVYFLVISAIAILNFYLIYLYAFTAFACILPFLPASLSYLISSTAILSHVEVTKYLNQRKIDG